MAEHSISFERKAERGERLAFQHHRSIQQIQLYLAYFSRCKPGANW
jgi:hypothetical protein